MVNLYSYNMKNPKEFLITLYCCPFTQCVKEYKSKFNLKRHIMYNHLGKKPFNCSVCKKSFVSKQNLIEHQFIHTGAKPYKCSNCGAKFRQISLLSLHKRTHSIDYEKTLLYALEVQSHDLDS
jgi:C2H2-type zinc finger/Zinc finger, C2H2 type